MGGGGGGGGGGGCSGCLSTPLSPQRPILISTKMFISLNINVISDLLDKNALLSFKMVS